MWGPGICDYGGVSLAKAVFGAAVVSSMLAGACTPGHSDSSGWSRRRGNAVITTGAVHGERWELVAFVDRAGRRCVDIRMAKGGPGGCGKGLLTEAVSVNRGAVRIADQAMVSFVSGRVAQNVSRLTIEFAEGSTSNVPIVGEGAGFDVNFFGTWIPGRVEVD